MFRGTRRALGCLISRRPPQPESPVSPQLCSMRSLRSLLALLLVAALVAPQVALAVPRLLLQDGDAAASRAEKQLHRLQAVRERIASGAAAYVEPAAGDAAPAAAGDQVWPIKEVAGTEVEITHAVKVSGGKVVDAAVRPGLNLDVTLTSGVTRFTDAPDTMSRDELFGYLFAQQVWIAEVSAIFTATTKTTVTGLTKPKAPTRITAKTLNPGELTPVVTYGLPASEISSYVYRTASAGPCTYTYQQLDATTGAALCSITFTGTATVPQLKWNGFGNVLRTGWTTLAGTVTCTLAASSKVQTGTCV